MKFVAAYLLATMGGNPSPSKDDVRAILDSVGTDADHEDKLDLLFASIAGKDVTDLIAAGREMLSFCPSGAASVAAAGPAAGGAGAGVEKEEEKVEEEKIEEEEDDNMFSLFDD